MSKFIPFTKEGMEKIRKEKDKLILSRKEAVNNLRIAREMGDLSENAAYKVARMKLSSIDSRIRYFNKILRFGRIIDAPPDGKVGIGSTVKLVSGGKEITYKIVGSFETDPSRGTISHLSPLGKVLMGKETGSTVNVIIPRGTVTYQIIEIS